MKIGLAVLCRAHILWVVSGSPPLVTDGRPAGVVWIGVNINSHVDEGGCVKS